MSHETTARRSVLLVDDDDFTTEFVKELLLNLGITDVPAASDGLQALKILGAMAHPPDLIICDLQMPGMDGVEFLRHLAANKFAGGVCLFSGMHLPVLQASGHLASAQQLNVLGVLEKPVGEQQLAGMLAKLGTVQRRPAQARADGELTPEELREGMAQGCLEVMYQPKVQVDERRLVAGAECLVRFRHPQQGLLGPNLFINVAEKHSLIDDLTIAVLAQAARQLAEWHRSMAGIKLSVNVSMLNLHRLDLPEIFDRTVRAAGTQPEDFILEITESRMPKQLPVSLDILVRLRLKGFQLSLDDFGTGYSTMQSLGQLPFTELKLDQQFVQGAIHDSKAMAILESSAQLAKALKLNLVAEGVERPDEWTLVERLGCNEVQGYWISRPIAANQFLTWKSEWEKRNTSSLA